MSCHEDHGLLPFYLIFMYNNDTHTDIQLDIFAIYLAHVSPEIHRRIAKRWSISYKLSGSVICRRNNMHFCRSSLILGFNDTGRRSGVKRWHVNVYVGTYLVQDPVGIGRLVSG